MGILLVESILLVARLKADRDRIKVIYLHKKNQKTLSSMIRAGDDVIKQRRIVTARRGSKSVSPPPSHQRSVGMDPSRISTPPRSPFTPKPNGCASEGRRIVRAVRVQRPNNIERIVPPRYSTPTVPSTATHEVACGEDDSPRPPLPCKSPQRYRAKRHNRANVTATPWEESMKAALIHIAKTRKSCNE